MSVDCVDLVRLSKNFFAPTDDCFQMWRASTFVQDAESSVEMFTASL